MLPEETIDYNLRKTWRKINKIYNKTASEYMGTVSLAMIVLNIDIYEGTLSTRLGPIMGMEMTSLSRSLKRLEDMGIIKRIISKEDKRKVIISLTELGLERREIAKNTVLNFNEVITSQLTKEEKDTFFNVLNKINKILNDKNLSL
jgi:DNA-binding MarR family transcriptional regulator